MTQAIAATRPPETRQPSSSTEPPGTSLCWFVRSWEQLRPSLFRLQRVSRSRDHSMTSPAPPSCLRCRSASSSGTWVSSTGQPWPLAVEVPRAPEQVAYSTPPIYQPPFTPQLPPPSNAPFPAPSSSLQDRSICDSSPARQCPRSISWLTDLSVSTQTPCQSHLASVKCCFGLHRNFSLTRG